MSAEALSRQAGKRDMQTRAAASVHGSDSSEVQALLNQAKRTCASTCNEEADVNVGHVVLSFRSGHSLTVFASRGLCNVALENYSPPYSW